MAISIKKRRLAANGEVPPPPSPPIPKQRRAKKTPLPEPVDDGTIDALYEARLAASGLTAKDAATLDIELLSPEAIMALGQPHFLPNAWAFRLPYFDLSGRRTEFYRLRYLKVIGFAGAAKKPPRYSQPANTIAGVYLTPMTFSGLGWKDIFTDPSVSLLITEGELKAIAACRAGFPTLGLGGVDSWRATKRGVPFLPELEAVDWAGRRAFIVFDSDLEKNPAVARALSKLCAELTARGALPETVRLPPGEQGAKTGLDDFLVAGGDLPALLEAAEPFALAAELLRLNDEVAYLREIDAVVELATGMLMTRESFAGGVYANRTYAEVVPGTNPSVVRRSAPKEWLTWARRFELSRLVYRPGEGRLTDDGAYNAWRGWGIEPKRGNIRPWRDLLDHLFKEAPEARRWFEAWAAYPLKCPGTKLYSAVLLHGELTGTGKSLIGYTLAAIYGVDNASVIGQADLHGDFNSWAARKQFVMGEEISGSDKRAEADALKAMITRLTVTINEKYKPQYTIEDCVNYYLTSNHPDALFVEQFDRRLFIHEVALGPMPMDFYLAYDKWLRAEGGAAAIFYHLLHDVDISWFIPQAAALSTGAKTAMIDLSRSDAGALIDEVLRDPAYFLSKWGVAVDALQPTQLQHLLKDELTRPVSLKILGMLLRRRLRVISKPVHKRLYIMRNVERWMAASERDLYAHWAAAFSLDLDGKKRSKLD